MALGDVGRDILGPVRDLGEYIRAQRTAAQISLRALADKAGVSNPYLSQVERGLRRPSATILTQIADGLSISAESLLVRAGILRSGDATPVVTAIRADEGLSERQKASLIEIYQAFRHEVAVRPDGERSGTSEPATAPSATAPSATAPSTTAPSTTAPSTTAPSTTAPPTTAASTNPTDPSTE